MMLWIETMAGGNSCGPPTRNERITYLSHFLIWTQNIYLLLRVKTAHLIQQSQLTLKHALEIQSHWLSKSNHIDACLVKLEQYASPLEDSSCFLNCFDFLTSNLSCSLKHLNKIKMLLGAEFLHFLKWTHYELNDEQLWWTN